MIFSELIIQTCSKLKLTFAVDLTQRQVANIDNLPCGEDFFTFFNYCNSVPASAAKQGYRQVATGSERCIVSYPSNRETMSKAKNCA